MSSLCVVKHSLPCSLRAHRCEQQLRDRVGRMRLPALSICSHVPRSHCWCVLRTRGFAACPSASCLCCLVSLPDVFRVCWGVLHALRPCCHALCGSACARRDSAMCMQCGATCLMLLCIQCGSACRAVAKWVKSWDPCVFGTSAGPSLQQQPQQGARGRGGKGSKQGSGKGSDGRPEYKAILLAGPPGACACLQCVCECVFECVCVCVCVRAMCM